MSVMNNSKVAGKKRMNNSPSNDLSKIKVHLEYACFICGNILNSAKTTIDHIKRIHSYSIPPREAGRKRPPNPEFEYVRDKKGQYTIVELACPSCWFHCPDDDLEALNEHTREEHDPVKIDNVVENGDTGGRVNQTPVTTDDEADLNEVYRKVDELINLFKEKFIA